MLSQAPQILSFGDAALQTAQALGRNPARWRDAWQIRCAHHPATIRFDRPTNTLPISLTGDACALKCAHCGGHYLHHMRPIWDASIDGAASYLISGGCDSRGRIPLVNHLEHIARLRAGHRLNWHVGLVDDEETLRQIAPYVDVISFDIVGDAETVREVYGLDLGLDDYMRTLALLRRYASVVPHITIGLRGGKPSGEHAALRALQSQGIEALILLILIPTPGTAYANCAPPDLADVADLFLEARILLPTTRLFLGCMRPVGAYRRAADELAVRAGFNGVVNPTRPAEDAAHELGLEIIWGNECCAL